MRVPEEGFDNLIYESVSLSISAPAATLNVSGVSSFVAYDCGVTKVGASFTGVMFIVTVETVAESATPSFARYVKESVPLKFAFGV